jgi:uncharacterized protein (TIGR00251 family)
MDQSRHAGAARRAEVPSKPAPSNAHKLKIDQVENGIAFEVHVVPRSPRNEIDGIHGDRLRVRVNVPPVEGAANHAVCTLIARVFGVAPTQVSIIRGLVSRMKRIHVAGIEETKAREALAV